MAERNYYLTYAMQHGKNAGLLSVLVGAGLFLLFNLVYALTANEAHQREAGWEVLTSEWVNISIYYINLALCMLWFGAIAGRRVITGQTTVFQACHTACFLTGWTGTVFYLLEESWYSKSISFFDEIGFSIFVLVILAVFAWLVGGIMAFFMSKFLSMRLDIPDWLPPGFMGK